MDSRPTLFFYPNSREGIKVFDYEDIIEEKLCIICYENPNKIVYIWNNNINS
jgi:hypothetical protein